MLPATPSTLKSESYKDFSDTLKRAIALVAIHPSAILWPLEDSCFINTEFYSFVCSQMKGVTFSKNPAALKRDEALLVLVEIDMAHYAQADDLSILKKKCSVLLKSLHKSRDCTGVIFSLGSNSDELSYPLSSVISCFETDFGDIFAVEAALNYELETDSGWNPNILVTVGLKAMETNQLLQYKALKFNDDADAVTELPALREWEEPETSQDVRLSKMLAPVEITPEAPNDSPFEDSFGIPANPMLSMLDISESRDSLTSSIEKSLKAEASAEEEFQLVEISVPCLIQDNFKVLVLRDGVAKFSEELSKNGVHLTWSDNTYLDISSEKPLQFESDDIFFGKAFTKLNTHLYSLNFMKGVGTVFDKHVGMEVTMIPFLDDFNLGAYGSENGGLLKAIEEAFSQ